MVGEGGSSNTSFTRTRVPSIVRLEDTCQVLGAVREFYWSLNRALGGDILLQTHRVKPLIRGLMSCNQCHESPYQRIAPTSLTRKRNHRHACRYSTQSHAVAQSSGSVAILEWNYWQGGGAGAATCPRFGTNHVHYTLVDRFRFPHMRPQRRCDACRVRHTSSSSPRAATRRPSSVARQALSSATLNW